LAERAWAIETAVLLVAGAWQFAPLKRRSLAVCRHPARPMAGGPAPLSGSLAFGIEQGIACLGSSWALMLLMFAQGPASLPWMAALTVVMVYEAVGHAGARLGSAVGVLLLLAAVATTAGVPV